MRGEVEKLLLNFTLRDRTESSEMDDFRSICLLSLAMLVACYVAGIIPLAVNFSEVRQLCQSAGWLLREKLEGKIFQEELVQSSCKYGSAVRGDVVTSKDF